MSKTYSLPISAECVEPFDLGAIQKAWKHSRPNDPGTDLETILKVDAPVNEFTHATFQITVPIILREVLCSLREHVVWARTSRVENLDVWPILDIAHERFELRTKIEHLHERMMKQKEKGQDHFRMELPLGYMTQLSVRFSWRTFVRFCSSLMAECHHAEFVHGEGSLMAVAFGSLRWALQEAVSRAIPHKDKPFLEYAVLSSAYGVEKLCPYATSHEPGIMRSGSFITVRLPSVPIALRAQMVRHRPLMVRDTLRDYFTDSSLALPIKSTVRMEVACSVETADAIASKRNCWISQTDLWQPFVEQLNKVVEVGPVLPCSTTGACPYGRDNELRLAGKDPAPPCPIWLRLAGKKPAGQEMEVAIAELARQRPSSEFWQNENAIYQEALEASP